MTEAQKEYFRGFRDGARAANRDEFKQVIEQLMAGVTDVFKSVPDKLIENINITVDTSAIEDWVKCCNEKPPMNEAVIVCYYGSDMIIPDYKNGETLEQCMNRLNKTPTVTVGYLTDEGWCSGDGFPMMIAPTYWKPMPEAPETE